MDIIFRIVGVLLFLSALFAVPCARRGGSAGRFFAAWGLCFFCVVFPLFVFVASAGLVPEWKGEYQLGWLSCFHLGKLALIPIVFWAASAYYMSKIYWARHTVPNWGVLGLFNGVVVRCDL